MARKRGGGGGGDAGLSNRLPSEGKKMTFILSGEGSVPAALDASIYGEKSTSLGSKGGGRNVTGEGKVVRGLEGSRRDVLPEGAPRGEARVRSAIIRGEAVLNEKACLS